MGNLQRARFSILAHRQIFDWFFTHLCGLTMTWLTKMGCTPTEPQCNRAAESALKLNVILSVLLAIRFE